MVASCTYTAVANRFGEFLFKIDAEMTGDQSLVKRPMKRIAEPLRKMGALIELTKAEIIRLSVSLGVSYAETHSCYDPIGDAACGRCDACVLRRKGFAEAAIPDPTRYA